MAPPETLLRNRQSLFLSWLLKTNRPDPVLWSIHDADAGWQGILVNDQIVIIKTARRFALILSSDFNAFE
jgi:hypothetical protein